jgi:nucleotide-binding universal stress UspA family protein
VSAKTVVVGVDGSADARAALAFALEEAAMRDASLRVVAAMQMPDYGLASFAGLPLPRPAELVDEVRTFTESHVDEVVAGHGDGADGVLVAVEAVVDHPGDALCSAADGAELVVGHRGRGAVASVVIGSVGLHCVLHAGCPVTIVRRNP